MPAQSGSRGDYSHIPIPSYEEAISSRPSSSQNYLGPSEISNDAEREGLLGRSQGDGGPSSSSSPFRGYRAPTVESARSSIDGLDNLDAGNEDGRASARESMEELRREMSEMEFEDTPSRNKWSTRLSSLNLNLQFTIPSRIRPYLPSRSSLPSWRSFQASLPDASFFNSFRCDFAIIIRLMAFGFVIFTGYLVFFSNAFSGRRPAAHTYDPESVRHYILEHVNEGRIRSDLYSITSYGHIAGTEGSFVLGKWIEEKWNNMKLGPVEKQRFEGFLNYPKEGGRKVYISEPEEQRWTAKLEEDQVYSEPPVQQTAVWHGHSRNANATGHLIYANYGSRADFEKLNSLGVKVDGAVALVRQGGSEPDQGLKVRIAEESGAVGVLIYSDPKDQDAELTMFNGQWRADGAVRRGAVSNTALFMGDVLSPGFASSANEQKRLNVDEARDLGYLPNIPSMPLAWHEDAEHLLKSISGAGRKLEEAAPDFVGGIPYLEWWTGDENSPKVTIENTQDEVERQPIYNILTLLEGTEQGASKVIVGNHRDAWCFGAVDPGSGTAIMMEVSHIFTELQRAGWRPARTIEFASWDGGEFNMMGSTEYVEANVDAIRKNTFAYVNVDAGVFGPNFEARASPIMERALFRVIDRMGPAEGVSLRKIWAERGNKLEGLGGGSDYVAFQNIAGVPSIDLGFSGSSYPKDSCFDEFGLLDRVFDPGFTNHKLLAQVLALVVLELADSPTVPFEFEAYATGISGWIDDLHKYTDSKPDLKLDFKPLHDAVKTMAESSKQHRQYEDQWDTEVVQMAGYEPPPMRAERVLHNDRSMQFEKDLLDLSKDGGLPGRTQFKHVLFAPDKTHGDTVSHFPAVRDAIESGDNEAAQTQIQKAADIIRTASENLVKSGPVE